MHMSTASCFLQDAGLSRCTPPIACFARTLWALCMPATRTQPEHRWHWSVAQPLCCLLSQVLPYCHAASLAYVLLTSLVPGVCLSPQHNSGAPLTSSPPIPPLWNQQVATYIRPVHPPLTSPIHLPYEHPSTARVCCTPHTRLHGIVHAQHRSLWILLGDRVRSLLHAALSSVRSCAHLPTLYEPNPQVYAQLAATLSGCAAPQPCMQFIIRGFGTFPCAHLPLLHARSSCVCTPHVPPWAGPSPPFCTQSFCALIHGPPGWWLTLCKSIVHMLLASKQLAQPC